MRRAVCLVCLALFLAEEASELRRVPWRARWDFFLRERLSGATRTREISLAFDPDYGAFLEAVRDTTPPGATIALSAPANHPLYTYEASYVLAPRRLVRPDLLSQADYAAVYGSEARPGERVALSVRKGSLFRLR
jgi:hypothetical protein